VRRILTSLLFVSLVACTVSEAQPDGLRVGHANVAGWAIYRGAPAAGDDLAALVVAQELDVVGVSEVCEAQLERAAAGIPGARAVFRRTIPLTAPVPWGPPSDEVCTLGNGLLLGPGITVHDTWSDELPTADGVPGDYDVEEDRNVVCARVASPGGPFVACTTHLSHLLTHPERRREQVEAVLAFASRNRQESEPVVLVGDFNARGGSADLAPVERAGWIDAVRRPRGTVQHVLLSEGSWVVEGRGRTSFGLSDHDAVWGVLARH
jgi:hypothetical protein